MGFEGIYCDFWEILGFGGNIVIFGKYCDFWGKLGKSSFSEREIFKDAHLTKSSLLENDMTLPKRGCSFVRTCSCVDQCLLINNFQA